MITKRIGKLMIVLGIGLLITPIAGSVYTCYEQKKLYQEYLQELELLNSQSKANDKNLNDGDDVLKVNQKMGKEDAKDKSAEDGEVIGRIKIPSINMDLMLIEGTDIKSLSLGAGHLENTAFPGEDGNCAIAGHRNYTFGQMFNRLGDIKLKDHIILETGEASYTYEVTDIKLVKPEDVTVLEQPKDKKEVTLITCHPIYRATHRLIITGKLCEWAESKS